MDKQPPPDKETETKIVKLQGLIKMLNKIVEMSIQNFIPQIDRAEKNFNDGYWGEAFLLLTSVLELQMHHLWQYFLLNSTGKLFKQYDELLGLKIYTEILWQVGYISESQKSDLKDFQKGRNTVAHFVSNHLQHGHPSDKILEERFNKGLKVSNELIDLLRRKSPKFSFDSKIFT